MLFDLREIRVGDVVLSGWEKTAIVRLALRVTTGDVRSTVQWLDLRDGKLIEFTYPNNVLQGGWIVLRDGVDVHNWRGK